MGAYTSPQVEFHNAHSTCSPRQRILDNRDCFPCNILQDPARYDCSGCILMSGLFFLPYSANFIKRANLERNLLLVNAFCLDSYVKRIYILN